MRKPAPPNDTPTSAAATVVALAAAASMAAELPSLKARGRDRDVFLAAAASAAAAWWWWCQAGVASWCRRASGVLLLCCGSAAVHPGSINPTDLLHGRLLAGAAPQAGERPDTLRVSGHPMAVAAAAAAAARSIIRNYSSDVNAFTMRWRRESRDTAVADGRPQWRPASRERACITTAG